MKDKTKLKVSEVFYSIQGEGRTMGIPSIFIRLSNCNMLCGGKGTQIDKQLHDGATWRCDTIEVWRKGTVQDHEDVLEDELIYLLEKHKVHLIITGGEPLLQQDAIISFLDFLAIRIGFYPFVEIETNGTIAPSPTLLHFVKQWNVSPKLANSGVPMQIRYVRNVLDSFPLDRTIFKFVVGGEEDWISIEEYFLRRNLVKRSQIWLMPAASTRSQLLEKNVVVSKLALDYCVNFCTRLQVEIWDQTTGV